MTDLPLFYHSVVPLDRTIHCGLALADPQRFGFARASHLVPAVVDEFGPACRHLPILFTPESLGPTPVFLTGSRPGRSELVADDGTWTGRYLPAYLRRYPFIVGEVAGAEPLICFDETAEAATIARGDAPVPDAGIPLFGADGSDAPILIERIRLVVDYAAAAKRTAAFGRTLQDLALLRPVTVELREAGRTQAHALHGFLAVDEPRLAALPADGLARLQAEGWLVPIYAHLVSLQSLADFAMPFTAPEHGQDPTIPHPAAIVSTGVIA